jgi:hypothetical protein
MSGQPRLRAAHQLLLEWKTTDHKFESRCCDVLWDFGFGPRVSFSRAMSKVRIADNFLKLAQQDRSFDASQSAASAREATDLPREFGG